MISPEQYAANRQNAALSTGPRTSEGKNRSAMNAVRHGLAGRVVVLPSEDMAEFQRFSRAVIESLAPETAAEREEAQSIADSQWRLNRILSIEDGLLALGHFEDPGEFDTQDPAINSVMSQARAFRDHSKSFVNLSIYEQRIHRTMEKACKRLHELQTARKAARDAEVAEAIRLRQTAEKQNVPCEDSPCEPAADTFVHANGFVYSSAEIVPEAGLGEHCSSGAKSHRKAA